MLLMFMSSLGRGVGEREGILCKCFGLRSSEVKRYSWKGIHKYLNIIEDLAGKFLGKLARKIFEKIGEENF